MEENVNAIIAKHREWKQKFDAAAPEEQKKMLAERAAEYEREERERKERAEIARKERFLLMANNTIKALELSVKARTIAMQTIKDFDGKVLNKRLEKVIQEKLSVFGRGTWCNLVIKYDYSLKQNVGELKVETTYWGNNDNRSASFYLKIILVPSVGSLNGIGERVSYSQTEENYNNGEEILTNQIAMWKKSIREYEKVLKQAQKIRAMIDDYGKVNYHLRNFFKGEGVISNGYYL